MGPFFTFLWLLQGRPFRLKHLIGNIIYKIHHLTYNYHNRNRQFEDMVAAQEVLVAAFVNLIGRFYKQ